TVCSPDRGRYLNAHSKPLALLADHLPLCPGACLGWGARDDLLLYVADQTERVSSEEFEFSAGKEMDWEVSLGAFQIPDGKSFSVAALDCLMRVVHLGGGGVHPQEEQTARG